MIQLEGDVRAVFLDAVGTLIHPAREVAEMYALAAGAHGEEISPHEAGQRFRAAFAAAEAEDAANGHRTDEAREMARWRGVVAAVLREADEAGREQAFQSLFRYYAMPSAWRADDEAEVLIERIRASGRTVGVASNFDSRLHGVLKGLKALRGLSPVVVSSEVGWKKPAPEFYLKACEAAGVRPEQAILIGDDVENDYHAARRAGLSAALIHPEGLPGVRSARRLGKLKRTFKRSILPGPS